MKIKPMKQLILALSILILTLAACNSGGSSNYGIKKPRPEMIFGEEKKELEAYIHFLDSVSNIASDLPIDTSGVIKGNFICKDSFADSANIWRVGKMYAQSDALEKGRKLYTFSRFEDLNAVLKGEVRHDSYSDFLTKTKQTNYLVLINNLTYLEPKMHGKDAFDGGQIISQIQVIDLKKFIIVKQQLFLAENSDNVATMEDYSGTGMLHNAMLEHDLWKNYVTELSGELKNLFRR